MKILERKELLKDLCARLPYGVICDCLHDSHIKLSVVDTEDLTVYYPDCDEWESIEYCKPYLRSMSSMTEEEVDEFIQFDVYADGEYVMPNYEAIDWLLKNHFDYRGLIERGLAIAVTKENNPYKD